MKPYLYNICLVIIVFNRVMDLMRSFPKSDMFLLFSSIVFVIRTIERAKSTYESGLMTVCF